MRREKTHIVNTVAARRCFNHAQREAVARCLVCGNFFCRECIAEHQGRMLCARCLSPGTAVRARGRLLAVLVRSVQLLIGVMILWLAFFMMGQTLLKAPSSFHEGTIWNTGEGRP